MKYSQFPFLENDYKILSLGLLIIVILLLIYVITIFFKDKKLKFIVLGGLFLRIGIIILDNFVRIVSFSSADGYVFHVNGWRALSNLNYWKIAYIEGVVVPIYRIFGEPFPIALVLLNLLSYILALIVLDKSMNLISKKEKKKKREIFLILNFSLGSALLNVSLLREGVMLFFTTSSIYFYLKKGLINKGISIFMILVSTYFHSGMIFILTGYLYKYLKKKKSKTYKIIIIIIFLIIARIVIQELSYFQGKTLDSVTKVNISDAGSIYISKSEGLINYLIAMPLRFFYFLFSPTPNYFRGLKDIFTFLFNSMIYFYLLLNIKKNYKSIKKNNSNNKILINSLLISFFVTAFVYSAGTSTAGTALRHRDKLIFLLSLIYYLTNYEFKKSKKLLSKIKINKIKKNLK